MSNPISFTLSPIFLPIHVHQTGPPRNGEGTIGKMHKFELKEYTRSQLTPVRDGETLLLPFHVKTRGFDGLMVTTYTISTTPKAPIKSSFPILFTSNSIIKQGLKMM